LLSRAKYQHLRSIVLYYEKFGVSW
jgi:hypothetical protein